MPAIDVNSLFARAEQAFVQGRLDSARADLLEVRRLAGDHPSVLHLLALVEKKRGDAAAARQAFEAALALAPGDPQLANNYANLLDSLGEYPSALARYEQALKAAPHFAEARYNRALLLQKLGRLDEALAELEAVASAAKPSAKLQSARGNVLRQLERLAEAAAAYDAALELEPRRVTALHGRARVAMERGEPDASERYRRALAQNPHDPELRLGLAEALEAEGKPEAIATLAETVAARPGWAHGQSILARMRWEAGEGEAFTRDLESALKSQPANRELWLAYVSALAAAELPGDAADAAARAHSALGPDEELQLLEALHASEAGNLDRAERLFAVLPDMPGKSLHELRHSIRIRDYEKALILEERARAEEGWGVAAWALSGLLWRVIGDSRAQWLHEQPGLVSVRQLDLTDAEIEAIAERLRGLHRTRAHPIGQSLRGGTQTRGRLFLREEPEVRLLRDAIAAAVAEHWDALPKADPTHPLLRHRHARPRFAGSWSVRLTGGGFHVAHVHPQGIVSSACYLAVPDAAEPEEGWLEIGRPPKELGMNLEPLVKVEPKPGRLALFPSTLFHGTRPFSSGERLTAAFDIVAG